MRKRESLRTVMDLEKLCQEHGVTCLVQVGAGDGYEADFIRSKIGCRAVAIEGHSGTQPMSDDIEWHIAVIGATDGPMNFYMNLDPNLSTQIERKIGVETKVEVQQRRLDTFCREHDIKPDALIIDTEGTTLDVLEGCGNLLNDMKVVFAECQTNVFRPGMRLVGEIDELLVACGMTAHTGPPSYDMGGQGNFTWVRNETKPDAA